MDPCAGLLFITSKGAATNLGILTSSGSVVTWRVVVRVSPAYAFQTTTPLERARPRPHSPFVACISGHSPLLLFAVYAFSPNVELTTSVGSSSVMVLPVWFELTSIAHARYGFSFGA